MDRLFQSLNEPAEKKNGFKSIFTENSQMTNWMFSCVKKTNYNVEDLRET